VSGRIAGVLVGIAVAVAGGAALAAPDAGCTMPGTSLYFGNGINTTYDEAWEDADDDLPRLAAEAKIADVVAIGIAYNHTDGFLADVMQTLKQKEEEDPRFGWYLLNNISGYLMRGLGVIGVLDLPADAAPLIATLQTVINQGLADSASRLGTFYDADVADQVSGYEEDLTVNGYRVVVVAHSQGTLYANAARAALAAVDSANLGSFGIVALGDAAEITFNGYVTSDNDLVINALRTLGKTVLPANVDVPVNTGDFTGHLFEATYINAQLPARSKVVALLSTVTQGRIYPAHASASCAVGGASTGAVAVSVGTVGACALTVSGGVKCWGGDPLTNGTPAMAPLQIVGLENGVKSISMGSTSACAVTAVGAVECWGSNTAGKLGNGSTTASSVPVPVTGLSSGVTSVSVGDDSSCAITADGSVMCWGDNISGQLGNGSRTNSPVPVPVVGLTAVTKVVVGKGTACGISAGGEVWCWGNSGNEILQIPSAPKPGDGLVPLQITGLTGVATDLGVGTNSACAIIMGGGVMCWGSNMFGQLGVVLPVPPGAVIVRGSLVPVPVTGLAAAARISVGNWTACAVLVDGSVHCWGNGGAGQLGNGSKSNALTPVQVTGLVGGFTSVSLGELVGCAVQSAGGVQCWGNINQGFLGNNQTAGSLVPVSVVGFPAGL
jgi:alpha-tubulin suppressor-like RCC1 family protein